MDNFCIRVARKRLCQNRNQVFVNFNRRHMARMLAQILRHSPNPRPYLQYKILRPNIRFPDDLIQDMRIYQKILTKLFLKTEIIFL